MGTVLTNVGSEISEACREGGDTSLAYDRKTSFRAVLAERRITRFLLIFLSPSSSYFPSWCLSRDRLIDLCAMYLFLECQSHSDEPVYSGFSPPL